MKTSDESIRSLDTQTSLPTGQQQARTRWGTHVSGQAFDRKKSSFLTEQAQTFMAQQALCVVAGLDVHDEISGLLVLGTPGFVQVLDAHTCLIRLEGSLADSRIIERLWQATLSGEETYLGLFFICHPTRERLCVQGTAELLQNSPLDQTSQAQESDWICLHVKQSFFHCPKYIKTRIPGLTFSVAEPPARKWQLPHLLHTHQPWLSGEVRAFLAEQVLCYLCTVDQEGQCAVNHRGGARGFLVALAPDDSFPNETILLPDYSGNGAFEAIGNILVTGKAALVIPDYTAQLALCISGSAHILELGDLSCELAQRCVGAERVVALTIRHVEMQTGDWSAPLAYARTRAATMQVHNDLDETCSTH